MKIDVTSRHAEFSPALRTYVAEEVQALGELGLDCEHAEIVLDQGREGLTCEILLRARHGDPLVA
jgi:ribosome-associated translation inhibitor RaiA